MNTLILDTSSEDRILCLKGESALIDASSRTGLTHSAQLLDTVDSLLAEAGIVIGDLSLIGCGIGPGSFTGVRIALTTVRMISQLLSLPVVGIRSHLLYVMHGCFSPGDQVLVAYDAKKKRVFGALYEVTGDPLGPLTVIQEGDYPIETLIEATSAGRIYGVGNGCELYSEKLEQVPHYEYLPGHLPDAALVCSLAEKLHEAGKSGGFETILPFYGRLSDAEVAKNRKREAK